jgi:hypothetical protein
MSLLRRLDADLKAAMKESDKARLSAVRMVKAAVKNRQIDMGRELSDEEITSVLLTLVKQAKESIDQFSKGGRDDLAAKEKQELCVLNSYLPQQLSPEELEKIILDAIKESSAVNEADMGKVMKVLMPRIKGVADGKSVNIRVKELLQASQS